MRACVVASILDKLEYIHTQYHDHVRELFVHSGPLHRKSSDIKEASWSAEERPGAGPGHWSKPWKRKAVVKQRQNSLLGLS